jgi:hypothetical protein
VDGQAQAALDLAQVVPHVVGIFSQIDSLQSKPSQPFSPVDRLRHGENDFDQIIILQTSNE